MNTSGHRIALPSFCAAFQPRGGFLSNPSLRIGF
jgi:hypothetical protein